MKEEKMRWNRINWTHELLTCNSLERAKKIQEEWAGIISQPLFLDTIEKTNKKDIQVISGVDISYVLVNKKELGVACATLWDMKRKELIEITTHEEIVSFPYTPGYLGFREVPLMLKALSKLSIKPDVILTDGHGKIHPRNMGEATHLGILMRIPTIGVAKNPFYATMDENWKTMKRMKGNYVKIYDLEKPRENLENRQIGIALCSRNESKPIFVSEGIGVDINLAREIVLDTTLDHRLPEPIYFADRESRNIIENNHTN